jgi:hypothetical protein
MTAMFKIACKVSEAVMPVASNMPKLSGARKAVRRPK